MLERALSLVLMMRDQLEAHKKLPLQVDVCSKEVKQKDIPHLHIL